MNDVTNTNYMDKVAIQQLYNRYFAMYKYINPYDGIYDRSLFIDMFSELDSDQINKLFLYAMGNVDFKKTEIELMISLGLDLINNNNYVDELLKTCPIDNLCRLIDCYGIRLRFNKDIGQKRICEFVESCNDMLFQILLDSGLTFKQIMVDSRLLSEKKMPSVQKYYFRNLSADKIDFIIKKTLEHGYDIDSIFLHRILRCLMTNVNRKLSLDEIRQFLNLGIDPRYDNDILFIESCRIPSSEIILFFINECGCDINARKSKALIKAIWYCPPNVKLLIELGININCELFSDHDIAQADNFYLNNIIDPIINNNIDNDNEKIATITIESVEYKKINLWKKLIGLGVDFNKIISEY